MAAAEIGASFSNYTGNAELGGGSFGVINIDTKPIQQLAAYTMLYNKSEYDQKQKDAEAYAKRIAEDTSYDLNSVIPEDREKIRKAYDEFIEWIRKNTDSQDYSKNPERYLEYKKRKGDLDNLILAGKTRNLMYISREAQIAQEKNPDQKLRLIDNLRKEASSTDIFTPLKHTQEYDLQFEEPPKPVGKKLTQIYFGPMSNVLTDMTILDMRHLKANAALIRFDMTAEVLDETTPEFQSLSEEEKNVKRDAAKAKSIARKNGWIAAADNFNKVFMVQKPDGTTEINPKFKNADETINVDALRKSDATGGVINAIEQYNQVVTAEKKRIKEGYYKNNTGKPIDFIEGTFNEKDYDEINWQDGLSGEEFAQIKMMAAWTEESKKTIIQETNDATDLRAAKVAERNAAVNEGELAEKIRQFNLTPRTTSGASGGSGKAEDLIKDPAILLGKHFQRLQGVFAQNPNAPSLTVGYQDIDPETRVAIGIEEGQKVEYKKDGSFIITNVTKDKDGKDVRIKVGTVETLKKGYIDAVKKGLSTDGTQTEGFQQRAEAGVTAMFGTSDAGAIWNGFLNPTPAQQTTTTTGKVPTTTPEPESEYSNITETNKGKIGLKNGKWYDITTGKEIK